MIFLDRQCHACNGKGCSECHGTGIVGGVNMKDMPLWKHKEGKIRHGHKKRGCLTPIDIITFGFSLRCWRLDRGFTFSELSAKTGILPGTLSEIENGRREPTEEQRRILEELIQ